MWINTYTCGVVGLHTRPMVPWNILRHPGLSKVKPINCDFCVIMKYFIHLKFYLFFQQDFNQELILKKGYSRGGEANFELGGSETPCSFVV